ncbi:MAG: two-component sensor histidine kinase [Labilithrix sp.]|nr:two-component sensor histidine kinase [Labilithrix sp.]
MAVRRALARAPLERRVKVAEAASAREALALLASTDIDCILLDLRLPGTTGIELLGEIRTAGWPQPVVMLTGHGDEQTAVDAMKAGAADYLSKALLDPERLARSILHALRMHAAERSGALAREQLEAAERRYRFLAESIPQMVWVTDADMEIEYVNGKWVAYTGLDLASARGQAWGRIVHPEDLAEVMRRWNEARATGSRFEVQVRLLRESDGTYRWHLCRAEALGGAGDALRWFGTSTDIEDQKQTEAELVRLRETAENERARAEEANRAKDEFLAILSHELRTPLNSILGWISMLRAPDATAEMIARGLVTIDRNARAQAQLIEDLLDVSRIVTGKLVLDRKTVDLRDVTAAALETVQPLAATRNVALEVDVPEEPLVVSGDASRLQQVVWNLLVNAVKFSPEGGRVIVRASHNGREAVVCVEDSGKGIDPHFLPHVFDRFRQADASFARSHGGLGLGLSIVQHLVERHGGRVTASSEGPGRGAVFTAAIPLDVGTVLPGPDRVDPSSESLVGLDILVIEDDEDTREMMTAALERHGAVVRVAGSVAEARNFLAARLPHVIVSDLGLPGEDGYGFIAELRGRTPEAGGRIPAIALTGYAGLEDQRRARAAGFDDHAAKPVDLKKLRRAIVRLAEQHRTRLRAG